MNDDRTLALIVEDEAPMRRFLKATLTNQEFRVIDAGTAKEGLSLFSSHRPDIVLLDLGLPDGDGLDVVARIRELSRLPIVVISARGREADKVNALDAGADDYVTKPFGTAELMARLRVALRHAAQARTGDLAPQVSVGTLTLDLERRVVMVADDEVHLTPTEYKILAMLARHLGKVVTHAQLLREVWGSTRSDQAHYVRVHMAQLRRKIEVDPVRPRLILTEPGVGYRLRET